MSRHVAARIAEQGQARAATGATGPEQTLLYRIVEQHRALRSRRKRFKLLPLDR